MSDFQIRRDQHVDKVMGLHAELLGRLEGILQGVDGNYVTPEQAVARIREAHHRNSAALKAAWAEHLGRAR